MKTIATLRRCFRVTPRATGVIEMQSHWESHHNFIFATAWNSSLLRQGPSGASTIQHIDLGVMVGQKTLAMSVEVLDRQGLDRQYMHGNWRLPYENPHEVRQLCNDDEMQW